MARKLRIEYAGAVYHVMNRGDRREAIFEDNRDWEGFDATAFRVVALWVWLPGSGKGVSAA
jgi:hypothetical protein